MKLYNMLVNEEIVKKIDHFFAKFPLQNYRKGEILVRAGDDPPGIFYLKKGQVKEYAISKKGDEAVVNVFKPGAYFPMSWAINQTPNAYFFEAMTDLELIRAPREKVIDFIKSEPEVLYNLLSRVYKGTDGLLSRMTYLMSGSAYERLVSELIIIIRRFGVTEEGKVYVKINEKELATQIGMTRETVSRELAKLKTSGLISFSKKQLIVKDVADLENEINASL